MRRIDFVFVAVKALEAWYLAGNQAMNAWLEPLIFTNPTLRLH